MSKANEIITYNQNDITGTIQILGSLQKCRDTMFFDNFASVYGKNKIQKILNTRGLEAYGIFPSANVDTIDKISQKIFSKVTDKKYILSLMYSPYYYVKYVQNELTGKMDEQKIQFGYDTLVDNSQVDIKRKWTVRELKYLIESDKVVLLGIKEKLLDDNSFFEGSLEQVDRTFVMTSENNFIEQNIFPSIKYVGNQIIMKNIANFEQKYEKMQKELHEVDSIKKKKILEYELENQQIVISSTLEHGQEQLKLIASEYQKKALRLQNLLNLNQKVLDAITPKQRTNEKDYE